MLPFLKKKPTREGTVGLEIRSDAVALAHVVGAEAGELRLQACERRRYEDAEELPRVLEELAQRHDLQGARCVCVLPPHQYSLRLLDAPEVETDELEQAARWLVKDLLDFPLEEAVVDHFGIPDQQSRGRPHRIYVVASRRQLVEELAGRVLEAGLCLEAVGIRELALRNLSARLAADEHGLALVHLGARSGLVNMSQGGHLYLSRQLETGVQSLIESERLIEREGHRFEPDEIGFQDDEDSNEMFEGLVLEIQRSLDYYESQLGQPPISQLVLSPLEHSVPELIGFLDKNLSAQVRWLKLADVLRVEAGLKAAEQSACLTAVGAALGAEADAS